MVDNLNKNPAKSVFYVSFLSILPYFIAGQLISFGFFLTALITLYYYYTTLTRFTRPNIKGNYIIYSLIGILSVTVFSGLYSIDVHLSIIGWRRVFTIAGLTYLALYLINQQHNPIAFPKKLVFYYLAAILVYAIFEHLTNYSLHRFFRDKLHIGGNINQPLDKATAFITLLLPFLLIKIKDTSWQLATTLFLASIYFLVHPMFAACLAFFLGLFTFGMIKVFKDKFITFVFCGALSLLAIAPIFYDMLINSTLGLKYYSILPLSWQHRVDMWQKAVELIKANPIHGYGFNTSSVIDKIPGFNPDTIIQMHPHSSFLQIWLEMGAMGSIAYGALIIAFMLKILSLKDDNLKIAATCSAVAYLIFSLFSFGLWSTWWLSSVALTILMANLCFSFNSKEQKQ